MLGAILSTDLGTDLCLHAYTHHVGTVGVTSSLPSPQYNQWICFASEGRAQDVSHPGFITITQGEISERLPPSGKGFI